MANQFISISELAQQSQNTHSRELIPGQWKEGQIILLHECKAITKLSTAASMIRAVNLHDTHRQILYIDAENNASTLAEYLSEDTHISKYPISVYRPTFDDDTLDRDYADLVISAIETAVKETEIRTFVVDSINRIAAASFGRNASPVHIMKKLVALQMRYGISLFVIAHTDSRSTREALIALSDKDFYAVPRAARKTTATTASPQHTPSQSSEHTPSQTLQHTPSSNPSTEPVGTDTELQSNHQQRQPVGADDKRIRQIPSSESSDTSDLSDLSDNTHSDLGFSINPDLPRAERRRLQKAAIKLQRLR